MSRRRLITAMVCSAAVVSGVAQVAVAAPSQDPVAVGDALTIQAGVEVRNGARSAYVVSLVTTPVAVGDGVRTDESGYAEIAYLEGSRTRLDRSTEFEVVELIDDAGVSTTRTSMGVGRTWHRVESLGEGEFTVETSQATATVRGTAFAVACETSSVCSFLLAEGSIALTLADGSVVVLSGAVEVEVANGVAGPITPVTFDRFFGDPWLADNAARDTAAGFANLSPTLRASTALVTEPEATTTVPDTETSMTEAETTTSEAATTTTDALTTVPDPETSTTEAQAETTTTSEAETTTTDSSTTVPDTETSTTEPDTETTTSTT
jgi:hypothetical protein